MKKLAIASNTRGIHGIIREITDQNIAGDGGIGTSLVTRKSDVCVNGMFLNYACYFQVAEGDMSSVVDFLLTERMDDGGFNCMSNRSGAHRSSLHCTLSVLEGILEYERAGYTYRLDELQKATATSREFILHTGYSNPTGLVRSLIRIF